MVVHVCGKFHSDRRLGTVARVTSREPGLQLMVLSVQEVPNPSSRLYSPPPDLADYVLVVREPKRGSRPMARPQGAARSDASALAVTRAPALPAQHPPVEVAAPASKPVPAAADAGARPGLGLMPDYDAGGRGMRVAMVVDGGAASAGGVKEGDVILGLGGIAVEDVQGYTDALDAQKVGAVVDVVVQRGDAVQVLQVKVGARSR
jgi:hypothetical protein